MDRIDLDARLDALAADVRSIKEDVRVLRALLEQRTQPPAPSGDQLLTTKEACAYLRVDPSTLYRLVKRGELKAVRFGKRGNRYKARDLARLADRCSRAQ